VHLPACGVVPADDPSSWRNRRIAQTVEDQSQTAAIQPNRRREVMSSAQVRPVSSTLAAGPMRESASFAAHLKTIERKVPLHSRYENFGSSAQFVGDIDVKSA
jgi:hypothetical protein